MKEEILQQKLHADDGLQEKLSFIAEYIKTPVALLDVMFNIIVCSENMLTTKATNEVVQKFRQEIQKKLKVLKMDQIIHETFYKNEQKLSCVVAQLQSAQNVIGYLIAIEQNVVLDIQHCKLLRNLGWICKTELLCQQEIVKVEKRYKDQFLYDVLYKNFESKADVIKRGKYWKCDFNKAHYICIIEVDEKLPAMDQEKLLMLVEYEVIQYLQKAYWQVITTILQEQVVVILQVNKEPVISQKEMKRLLENLQIYLNGNMGMHTFSIGIGKFYSSVGDLCRSYQEAKQALSLGKFIQATAKITAFEDLGILKLLSHISVEQLDDYYQETLGALIEYDKLNETNYLEVLKIYFQQNEELGATAERLFIHINTLRNRIKKIEEILEIDLQKTEEKVKAYVACQCSKIVHQGDF